jgi:hypothetical protein
MNFRILRCHLVQSEMLLVIVIVFIENHSMDRENKRLYFIFIYDAYHMLSVRILTNLWKDKDA